MVFRFKVCMAPCVAAAAAAAIIFGLGAPPAHASPRLGASAGWMVAQAHKRFNVSGVVESVSYVSNTVRVGADGNHLEILITPTTAIEYRGEAGSISDIRRGSKITVSGVIREGSWIANSVVIH